MTSTRPAPSRSTRLYELLPREAPPESGKRGLRFSGELLANGHYRIDASATRGRPRHFADLYGSVGMEPLRGTPHEALAFAAKLALETDGLDFDGLRDFRSALVEFAENAGKSASSFPRRGFDAWDAAGQCFGSVGRGVPDFQVFDHSGGDGFLLD